MIGTRTKLAIAAVALVLLGAAFWSWWNIPRGAETYMTFDRIPEEGVEEDALVHLNRSHVEAEVPALVPVLDEANATGSAEVRDLTLRREITGFLRDELGRSPAIYYVGWEGDFFLVGTITIERGN